MVEGVWYLTCFIVAANNYSPDTYSWLPHACLWCLGRSRGQYLCRVALFNQQTHIVRLMFHNDSRLHIKDCGCKGAAEEGPQGRNQLSWWCLYSHLTTIILWLNMSTDQVQYTTITWSIDSAIQLLNTLWLQSRTTKAHLFWWTDFDASKNAPKGLKLQKWVLWK